MERLRTIDEFKTLQGLIIADRNPDKPVIVINAGTCGQASGANGLIRVTKSELLRRRLTEKITLRITGCQGFCEMEPSVLIMPGEIFYPRVSMDNMVKIIDAIEEGKILEDLLYLDADTGKHITKQSDIPFFAKQIRTLMADNEKIDPIRVFDYIDNGGYAALVKALEIGEPNWVIGEIKASGLRGRGGAGFPTGIKWELLAKQPNHGGKFLVCNADEGDPGAYMDRSLLEGNPHSIIEGMLLGAYATGASNGVVYVRAEYPLAIKHLIIALRQAHDLGMLGKNILGTGFCFDIEIVKGAGAFVCGEETALIHSIEGKMGEPRQRPPYPIEKGINGQPTAINNVETWANVPKIILKGYENFSKIGTEKGKGTKIFSLVGKIKNTGLVEVPMGMSLNEIVYDIGGGASGNHKIKGIQTGGPSGGCIPVKNFNLLIDYDSLAQAGSIMGSGGMIVMDEGTCMVDVAKYFMSFLKDESCGKCFTCRKGTQRMYEILDDISRGKGTLEQLDLLEELALAVKDTTMCGLGNSAANPVLSTLRYFRHEYERHIIDKVCDAYVCRELVGAPCQTACPLGTQAWRYVALLEKGQYNDAYWAIRDANPFPSVCARVCHHPCEMHCRAGSTGSQPVAIRALKRFITDRVEPSSYKPIKVKSDGAEKHKIAIIGAGPAGLTAAHFLSLKGYKSTIFEAMDRPGGMLVSGIPAMRLPREVVEKEIASLIDENITLQLEKILGSDISIDGLKKEGYSAIFIATGAPKSKLMGIEGEDAAGVYPSMHYLRSYNLFGKNLAEGHVGIIGGGNSAIDAARVAIRQSNVKDVTIIYRRSRKEMPAYEEEIEGALEEGIQIYELVAPTKIITKDGKISAIECQKNKLSDRDASGRRKPVGIPGSEFTIPIDTLIVAISEESDLKAITSAGIEMNPDGTMKIDAETLTTSVPGIFAGGDVVTGPNSVVEAIAAGKKAAVMIDRLLRGLELKQPPKPILPELFIEPAVEEEGMAEVGRVKPPHTPPTKRKGSFVEVELCLGETEARQEARRCLRCDLEFTTPDTESSCSGNEVKQA